MQCKKTKARPRVFRDLFELEDVLRRSVGYGASIECAKRSLKDLERLGLRATVTSASESAGHSENAGPEALNRPRQAAPP